VIPAPLLAFLGNRYVLAALAGAAALFAAWWWHTSAISEAVEARDREWKGKVAAVKALHREEIAGWVLEMVTRDEKARELYAAKKAEREIVYRTLIEEVPRYVTPLADSRCIVPHGFVLHHDAAAAGRAAALPEGPGELVDADSGIALSAVERTVSENYEACHDAIAEVTEWRRWYPEASESYNRLRDRLAQPAKE
jgi:hypothetical protein